MGSWGVGCTPCWAPGGGLSRFDFQLILNNLSNMNEILIACTFHPSPLISKSNSSCEQSYNCHHKEKQNPED